MRLTENANGFVVGLSLMSAVGQWLLGGPILVQKKCCRCVTSPRIRWTINSAPKQQVEWHLSTRGPLLVLEWMDGLVWGVGGPTAKTRDGIGIIRPYGCTRKIKMRWRCCTARDGRWQTPGITLPSRTHTIYAYIRHEYFEYEMYWLYVILYVNQHVLCIQLYCMLHAYSTSSKSINTLGVLLVGGLED